MEIIYSKHWLRKHSRKRKDITSDIIEFALKNSDELKDKYWENAFNALTKIPPAGITLKVVYKKPKGKIFIISAYWLD